MRKSVVVLASLVSAFALAGPAVAQGGSKQAKKPTILVVSLKRIIDESKEGKEFVGRLRQEIAKKKQEIADEVRAFQEHTKKLMEVQLPDRDPKWYEQIQEALETQARLKAQEQYFISRMNDDIARRVNQIIRGAQQESRRVMKERGAELVLISRMGPIQINNDQELQDEIIFRRVMCADGTIDITDEVLKRMDAWYEENKGSDGDVPDRPADNGDKPQPEGAKDAEKASG